MRNNHEHIQLTSAEIGKLWATYIGNTMATHILSYYLQHVEDPDIKKVLHDASHLSQSFLQTIKDMFIQEDFPLPIGFTEEDVNLDAPRLFSDEFYLHYLKYVSKAGLSIYSIAIALVTREDVRAFFENCLTSTVKLIAEINRVSMEKGFLMKLPTIPAPVAVEFVQKQSYLKGFFGNIRPLHTLEITHLHDNIENNIASKALLLGFSQVAKSERIKQFFIRGKEITNKQVDLCCEQLDNDNLPFPSSLDHLVSTSTISPFSDKLMLNHKIDMFSMKIRSYGNALSLSGRRDLGAMYPRFIADVALYVEDAANIMIDKGWLEQPPQAVDRDHLT